MSKASDRHDEIDFDELDKAVSSLISTSKSSQAPRQSASPERVESTVQSARSVPVLSTKPAESKTSEREEEPSRAAPPPSVAVKVTPRRSPRLGAQPPRSTATQRRTSGFMDIITRPAQPPSQKPSREASTVEPAVVPVVPKAPPSVPVVEEPQTQAETLTGEAPPFAEPDSAEPLIDSSESLAQAEAETDSESAAPTPPFIPAKVEKRPLGAYSSYAPEPANPPVEEEPQPSKELAPEPPAESKKEKTQPEASFAIPEQYKTTAAPSDDTPRPVYDTKEYHPPLLEVPKGKTAKSRSEKPAKAGGDKWVKWVLVFLVVVVLVVAGFFAYAVITQQPL